MWIRSIMVSWFHKSIQYALERLGKSKFGFESTTVSNFKSKSHEGSRNELVAELCVLVLTKRHVGSGNEINAYHVSRQQLVSRGKRDRCVKMAHCAIGNEVS